MRVSATILLIFLGACANDSVTWSDPVFSGSPVAPNEYSAWTIADAMGCQASLRKSAVLNGGFATWWRVRPDSSAVLMVARLTSAGINEPVVADSTDRSRRGCSRPAPAIAVDSESGYVHVAYFLEPDAGSGIFFAHSMDSGSTFHSPVPIVFGRNPSRVSVASRGNKVIVAFEDPNAAEPIVGVSLSRTMGHLFEERMSVSSGNGRAEQPVIRLSHDSIHLWWSEYSADPAVSATRSAYESGRWR